MTKAGDLEATIRLACLTEDRTDAEQRALLRTAQRLDRERNACVVKNPAMWGEHAGSTRAVRQQEPSQLVQVVQATRVLGDGDHEVHLPKKRT